MWKLTVFLSIIWAVSLLYGEWFTYLVPSLWTCNWPHLQQRSHSSSSSSSSPNASSHPSSNYVKVAVITDPQLMDRTSHSLAPKSLALEMAQFYTDLYMRRAFLSSVLPFDPDFILFLGDYFDGGDQLSDEEWQESLGRLKHIFSLNTFQQTLNKVYYLSGNHDIGYAAFNSRKPEIIRRFEREFGPRNFKVTLGKVDFIAVDAQTVDGLPNGNLTSATWNFVKNVAEGNGSTPRVLLTHIPLYRPDWTPCGPHRGSQVINQRIYRANHDQDISYQNYITPTSSKLLLDLIRPTIVLSGHDHDQCSVTHTSEHGPVTEHTVGTVSWQQGNLYPSFMLLSSSNSTVTPEEAVLTHLCFLPMQTHIYIWYLSLFTMTLVITLLWPANEVLILRKLGDVMGYFRSLFDFSSFSISTKEKNDDENCEYEEIWDSEGSMHLIKKASKPSKTTSNERNLMERGNAVMRSNARKQTGPDTDALNSDISIHMGSDGVVKVPARTNKSKAKIMIWRLLRALRALTVIASINVPLYVFLVFKDWIDK